MKLIKVSKADAQLDRYLDLLEKSINNIEIALNNIKKNVRNSTYDEAIEVEAVVGNLIDSSRDFIKEGDRVLSAAHFIIKENEQ